MKKYKDIIIIISILITSIVITIIYSNKNNFEYNTEATIEKTTNQITIKVEGEILEELEIECNKGVTFRYIENIISPYLNSYSIINIPYNTTYYEDTIIYIETSDKKVVITPPANTTTTPPATNKININTASIEELMKLERIGEKRSNSIKTRIKEVGPFKDFIEFQEFIGLSDEIIESIKKQAVIE